MFIEQVMQYLWEPVSIQYAELKQKMHELSEHDLEDRIKIRLTASCNPSVTEWLNMTSLITSGCPHKVNKGIFCGCSMCNYFIADMECLVMMNEVKERNAGLYGSLIQYYFKNVRGIKQMPNLFEYISGHDSLSTEEFPEEAFNQMYLSGELFSSKPYRLVMETRAVNVSEERLSACKKKCAKNVEIAFGVEVYPEWLRNHWLNKDIKNEDITEAIHTIKKCRCNSRANLLVGIPGLNEKQSLLLLERSAGILLETGVDNITISPLISKEMTLQEFLYQNLRENKTLGDNHIIGCMEDGNPSVFFLFDAVYRLMSKKDLLNITVFAPVNFSRFFDKKEKYYKGTEQYDAYCIIREAMSEFDVKRDINILNKANMILDNNEQYLSYLGCKEHQPGMEGIPDTIYLIGQEIAKLLWPDNWREKVWMLQEELKQYDTQDKPWRQS